MLSFKDFAKQYSDFKKGKKADEDVRISLAKDPKKAGKLVHDESPRVRMEVAKHAEHAEKLVTVSGGSPKGNRKPHEIEPDHRVRWIAARHPEVAGYLVNDPHPDVKERANQTQWVHHIKRNLNMEAKEAL